MGYTRKQLSEMSRDELTEAYDDIATSGVDELSAVDEVKQSIIQDEIHRRDQQAVSNQMWWMTLVITILTLSNVTLVAYEVISSL